MEKYRGMICSLLYINASRSKIMFSVFKCARFQVAPKESHLMVIKRILRYLKGTYDFGLYQKDQPFNLKCFSDFNYARFLVDRKSTGGTFQFLVEWLVSLFFEKQILYPCIP